MNDELFEEKREFIAKLMDQGFQEVRAKAEWNTHQENKGKNPARKLVEEAFSGVKFYPSGVLVCDFRQTNRNMVSG